jgi:hypothetical protein
MSKSFVVDYVKHSKNRSNRTDDIDTVTIHCVVGQLTVEALCDWFSSPSCNTSANYVIGLDGRIGECVPEEYRAWTTGGYDKKGNPIYVNGISGSMNDHRAITIEVASDTTHPYAVTSEAYEGLIRLLVDICKRHPKIGQLRWMNDKNLVGQVHLQNMTAHRWFANKACPGDYLYNRFGDIASRVNKQLIDVEEEDMDVNRFKELFQEMRKDLQDNEAGQWSQEARDWAIQTGLVKGNGVASDGQPNGMWEDLLTREQLVTVLYRFAQMMGKV